MKLLTHNFLKCNAKGIVNGFPMKVEISDMEVIETEFNIEFMRHVLPSLDWAGVLLISTAVGFQGLPISYDDSILNDETMLRALHSLLNDIHIKSGFLICPESDRRFPIVNGIPNLKLNELEVE